MYCVLSHVSTLLSGDWRWWQSVESNPPASSSRAGFAISPAFAWCLSPGMRECVGHSSRHFAIHDRNGPYSVSMSGSLYTVPRPFLCPDFRWPRSLGTQAARRNGDRTLQSDEPLECVCSALGTRSAGVALLERPACLRVFFFAATRARLAWYVVFGKVPDRLPAIGAGGFDRTLPLLRSATCPKLSSRPTQDDWGES